eukprot:TRINITY_DN2183_c0_g1_i1.p1 TRINITY_DN2183_c0_g1~~TRINITY_DN2183_c0_g1_i1.p1  ORF type:complete len:196 (+),score=13.63 TRINITY_DN2183_c0_g1_i1:64-651(+)
MSFAHPTYSRLASPAGESDDDEPYHDSIAMHLSLNADNTDYSTRTMQEVQDDRTCCCYQKACGVTVLWNRCTRPAWFGLRPARVALFVAAALFGFFLYFTLGAKHTGTQPKVAFNILVYRKSGPQGQGLCWHVHHWMWMGFIALVIGLTLLLGKGQLTIPAVFMFGFLLGGSLEDLRYTDFYKINSLCDQLHIKT